MTCPGNCISCESDEKLNCPIEIAEVAKRNADVSSSMSTASSGAAASVANTASGPSAFGIVILTKFLIYIRYLKI